MKHSLLYMMVLLGLSVLPQSCTQTAEPEGYGYVEINVMKDTSTDDVEISPSYGTVSTKADGEDVIALTIYDAADAVAYSTDDCSSVTEPIVLKTGTYRATATSGAGLSGGACFDTPFYSASKEFTVRRGVVEPLELTLALEAVMVTVEFSQEIQDNFASYVLTVSNGAPDPGVGAWGAGTGEDAGQAGSALPEKEAAGNVLVFRNAIEEDNAQGLPARESTLGRTGYFAVTGTLTYSLELIANDGRVFRPLVDTYTGVKPKQHYAFRFGVAGKQPEGAAEITITVDDSMTEKEHDIMLDFNVKDIPQITGSFDPASGLEFYAGDDSGKSLKIDLKKPAVHLTLSHDDAGLEAAGLPESVDLVGAEAGTIEELAALGIKTESVTSGMTEVTVDFTDFFAKLPAGSYAFDLFVQNEAGGELSQHVNVEVLPCVGTVSANAWARFAVLTGKWSTDNRPEGLGFQWRTPEGEWIDVESEVTSDAGTKTFTAELMGLAPDTEYEFRAVCAQERNTSPVGFTTETEQTVPNMNFDSWTDQYTLTGGWDSANKGSSAISMYPTSQETSHLAVSGDGKSAAKLQSLYKNLVIMDVFAAGNLYTGQFGSAIMDPGNPGATLDWGVPFTSRPLALNGYYDYAPGTVNHGTYNDMSGKTDMGQIQIMLTDWDTPYTINTQTKDFVDTTGDDIIAYGTMDLSATDGGYQKFTIKLDYRDKTRVPKYIVIVAAASKYGDYFTGSDGSVLYVDEFSLIYDPALLDE